MHAIVISNKLCARVARQSRAYLLRFWRITVGALLCQSRSHVPQARASRLFLALLVSNAPKLLRTRGRGISVRDKANERSCSLCATASEFNAVLGGKTRTSGEANMLALPTQKTTRDARSFGLKSFKLTLSLSTLRPSPPPRRAARRSRRARNRAHRPRPCRRPSFWTG